MRQAKTVVSITPMKIQADSRSFKIAASIASFGYSSIVVEGSKSKLNRDRLPFALCTIADSFQTNGTPPPNEPSRSRNRHLRVGVHEAWKGVRARLPFLSVLIFMLRYIQRCVVIPLKHIPKATLYYLHGITLFPAVYLLCKRYKVPFIYDAHDFYPGMYSPDEMRDLDFPQRWITIFYQYIESQIVKNASAVITVSDGVAGLLRNTFNCRPLVLRNCHDSRLDREPPKRLRQLLGLSSNEFVLVAVGNAKEGMAIEEVLDAMTELPPRVHLVFLGRFYEPFMSSIRCRALDDRVHVLPPVNPYEVVPFIRDADASIILYYPKSVDYANSLPNRFFQPIAAELPLLYPELSEIKRIAEKYSVGIPVNPQEPRTISEAVAQLMNKPSLSATFKRNLQTAREELSWENEERILRTLISAALEQDDESFTLALDSLRH